jgi:hypothetical protein
MTLMSAAGDDAAASRVYLAAAKAAMQVSQDLTRMHTTACCTN